MTSYSFDVIADGDVHPDETGVVVPDGGDLAQVAFRRAASLIQDVVERRPEWWLMEVRDGDRRIVGRISLVVSGFGSPRQGG